MKDIRSYHTGGGGKYIVFSKQGECFSFVISCYAGGPFQQWIHVDGKSGWRDKYLSLHECKYLHRKEITVSLTKLFIFLIVFD